MFFSVAYLLDMQTAWEWTGSMEDFGLQLGRFSLLQDASSEQETRRLCLRLTLCTPTLRFWEQAVLHGPFMSSSFKLWLAALSFEEFGDLIPELQLPFKHPVMFGFLSSLGISQAACTFKPKVGNETIQEKKSMNERIFVHLHVSASCPEGKEEGVCANWC